MRDKKKSIHFFLTSNYTFLLDEIWFIILHNISHLNHNSGSIFDRNKFSINWVFTRKTSIASSSVVYAQNFFFSWAIFFFCQIINAEGWRRLKNYGKFYLLNLRVNFAWGKNRNFRVFIRKFWRHWKEDWIYCGMVSTLC